MSRLGARDSPLVSTQWLADHLGSEDLVVLDASVVRWHRPDGGTGCLSGHEEYILVGHIPGAVFADLIDDLSDAAADLAFTRPDAARFAAAAGALGIGPETTVIVYDGDIGQWASRLWWLLRSFGHREVAVLDGGLTKWTAEGRPLETGHVQPTAAEFSAEEVPGFWADKAEVERVVSGEAAGVLVCASPESEFTGEVAPGSRRPGHIPGSLSAPAGRLVDRAQHSARPVPELTEVLGDAATAPRVIVYCSSGIAAAAAALALTLTGAGSVSVYDGSLGEWSADPAAPLRLGA